MILRIIKGLNVTANAVAKCTAEKNVKIATIVQNVNVNFAQKAGDKIKRKLNEKT